MRPEESARIARRIASNVTSDIRPSKSVVEQDLRDLMAAVSGDEAARKSLSSRISSRIPALGELEKAFAESGNNAPEMRHIKKGVWAGRYPTSTTRGIPVVIQASPNGDVQKVLVAGHPVSSWKETVEATLHFVAMADNGTPEDAEDIENSQEAIGGRIMKCSKCGGPVAIDEDFRCQKCKQEYISCPGCEQPYPMEANEDDHCPLCGYSSWSEMDPDVSDEYKAALVDAVKKASESRKKEDANFKDFQFSVEIVDRGGLPTIEFRSENDADDHPLAEWMENPSIVLASDADTHLWTQDHELMKPMEAWKGPLPEGWKPMHSENAPQQGQQDQGQQEG